MKWGNKSSHNWGAFQTNINQIDQETFNHLKWGWNGEERGYCISFSTTPRTERERERERAKNWDKICLSKTNLVWSCYIVIGMCSGQYSSHKWGFSTWTLLVFFLTQLVKGRWWDQIRPASCWGPRQRRAFGPASCWWLLDWHLVFFNTTQIQMDGLGESPSIFFVKNE